MARGSMRSSIWKALVIWYMPKCLVPGHWLQISMLKVSEVSELRGWACLCL